ncbi:MAG TPA: energy-coupling factor ABC transporter substrate-binding protein [Nodularia sp. (in: cyanobacteria)]|nr:energy-coupling factor ABC transporter substrate-binding protein [Nodularia sp. (in: cyanobacteria)]
MNQSKNGLSNWLLVVGVIILAVAPLILIRGAEFGGADDQAKEAIGEVQPGYEAWFKPVFKPPSGVENLLFTSQAALGAGVIGYVIGLYKERNRQERNKG